jgi:hypothetical protein
MITCAEGAGGLNAGVEVAGKLNCMPEVSTKINFKKEKPCG